MLNRRILLTVALSSLALGSPHALQAARLRPPTIFVPSAGAATQTFYVNGQPLAIILSDSLSLMLSMDIDHVAGKDFLRVWAFVQNNSDATIELIPQSQFALKALSIDFELIRLARPQVPTTVLQRLEDERASRQSLAMLGGVIASLGAALSTSNTTGEARTRAFPSGQTYETRFEIQDAKDKLDSKLGHIDSNTRQTIDQIQRLYEGAKVAVSSEMLRRNTLPPHLSANGYLYFDIESAEVIEAPDVRNRKFERPRDQTYVLFVRIPSFPEQRVSFWPSEGE